MPSQSPGDSVSKADAVISYSLAAVGHEPLKKPKTPGQDPISKEPAGFWDEALQAPLMLCVRQDSAWGRGPSGETGYPVLSRQPRAKVPGGTVWDEALQAPSNAVRQASTQAGGEALLERRGIPTCPDSPGLRSLEAPCLTVDLPACLHPPRRPPLAASVLLERGRRPRLLV